jgi:hypothetical protein
MQYVEEAFKAHPGAPMLKVVPPKGWTPRTAAFPNLDDIRISTPIKQHVSIVHVCGMLGDVVRSFSMAAGALDHLVPTASGWLLAGG